MEITAAVLRERLGPYRMEKLELDEPKDDELLVRVLGSGICHTDTFMSGVFPFPNYLLGHEGAGIVEKVGAKVTKFKPGDKVVGTFFNCGSCPTCKMGKPTYCLDSARVNFSGRRPDGTFTTHKDGDPVYSAFFGQSSFASYMITNEANTVKIRDDAPVEIMGPLGCGIQTGAGTVINTLHVPAGSSIAVFGTGGVGLSSIMAAKVVGCTTIIAVDVHQHRLELAKELGATHIINSKEEDPLEKINEITNGFGVRYSIDTSANITAAKQAILCTNHRIGECVLAAVSGEEITVMYKDIQGGRIVRGVMEGDAISDQFIPAIVDLYMNGQFPFDKMIKKYKLEDIQQAIEDMESGVTIKPVLIP